jgi:hypothetical protein
MNFTLHYTDENLKNVSFSFYADNTKEARNFSNKYLKDKKYTEPYLTQMGAPFYKISIF